MSYRCSDCGTEIQGNSLYCVRCYRERLKPCGACMVWIAGIGWRIRKKGRPPCPMDCDVCKNERWILDTGKGVGR